MQGQHFLVILCPNESLDMFGAYFVEDLLLSFTPFGSPKCLHSQFLGLPSCSPLFLRLHSLPVACANPPESKLIGALSYGSGQKALRLLIPPKNRPSNHFTTLLSALV